MPTDETVGDQSYSNQTAWGWVPAGRQARRAAAAALEPGRGVNAGNLCLTTMPFVSARPSIHLLRCACCVKCKAAPPIFFSLPRLPLIDAMQMHAFALLCSSFTHARATVTSPSQAPTTVLLRKPGLRSAGFVQNCRARAFSLKLHGRREKPSSQISGTGGWLEITDFQNSDTKGGL